MYNYSYYNLMYKFLKKYIDQNVNFLEPISVFTHNITYVHPLIMHDNGISLSIVFRKTVITGLQITHLNNLIGQFGL